MADLERRGGYTPRRVREQRAFRLLAIGGTVGAVGVIGLLLAILGVTSAGWPIVALIIAAVCLAMFRATVGR